ncbi:MAG: DUF3108 domain-containing protein [Gammaproteobacteria bacterium]|jgi:hypothetical protein
MIRFFAATAFGLAFSAASVSAQLVEYSAEYAAQYKGRNVGTSVFALERDAESQRYVFSSTMQVKGILRLASPRPIVDRSEFVLEGNAIVPQRFTHEDGSRKGEDNHTITFDWSTAVAEVNGDGFNREISLRRGVLDRGSVQVALMQTLAAGRQPESFAVLDEEAIDEYSYEFQGQHTIATEIGEIEVLRYRQQRAGSSRYTIIDLAPQLDYVPARIEQIRDGESQSAFHIESLERP